MPNLRLREDLEARPVEEGGLRFFDVSDPRSGASMRMYEHEWLLARRLDGAGSYQEVAGWARTHVGFEPSPQDIAGYARALARLGFFDEPETVAHLPIEGSGQVRAAAAGDAVRAVALDADSGRAGDAEGARSIAPAAAPTVVSPAATQPPQATVPAAAAAAVAPTVPDVPRVPDEALQALSAQGRPPAAERPAATPAPLAPPSQATAAGPEAQTALLPQTSAAPGGAAIAAPRKAGGIPGVLTLLLVAVAGGAAYFFLIAPALAPAHVRVQTVPPARDVVHYATSRGVVKQLAPVPLAFAEGGKIVDVVPVGAVTTPGRTLATLDTYQQLQKDLADVRDREAFYENQLKVATEKAHRSDMKVFAAKIAEKKALRVALETKVANARIVAPEAATVSEVTAAVGATVAANAPVLKLVSKRLLADVKVQPGEAPLFKAGSELDATTADGKQAFRVRVGVVEGDTAHLEVEPGAPALPEGAAVTIVRSRVPHVIALPPNALSKTQGGVDQVFLLTGEVVRARPVTIVERSTSEVLVSAESFSPNDRVVIDPPATLEDGQKALAAP